MAVDEGGGAENMGKKIQCIGRYVMDGQVLGKGNFARVELATHSVTGCKVGVLGVVVRSHSVCFTLYTTCVVQVIICCTIVLYLCVYSLLYVAPIVFVHC